MIAASRRESPEVVARKKLRRSRSAGLPPWVVGLVILAVALASSVIMMVERRGGPGATARRSTSAAATASARAFAQIRTALGPLLNDAPSLSALMKEIAGGSHPVPSVDNLAKQWAAHFQAARLAVTKLDWPTKDTARSAQSLYEMGAGLYTEAALAIPRLVAVEGQPRLRQDAWKAVSRLQLLGDRVFDAGNRLLGDPQLSGIVERAFLPPEVPNFAVEGLLPGERPDGPTLRADPYRKDAPTAAPGKWLSAHRSVITFAVGQIDDSSHWVASGATANEAGQLGSLATALEESTDRLADFVPSSQAAREGVHDLRLALLVTAESLRTLAGQQDETALAQARRLRLIGDRLWSVGSGLLVSDKAGTPSLYAVAPSGVDPQLLQMSMS